MTPYDSFERNLADALRSDEMPSADFAERVAAQVCRTPQMKSASPERRGRLALTVAACLAMAALAVPMVFFTATRADSAAPQAADCAVAEETCDAGAGTYDTLTPDYKAKKESVAETEERETPMPTSPAENGAAVKSDTDEYDGKTTVHVSDTALCRQAREILSEMGMESDSGFYILTAEQAAALREAIPALELPVGALVLVLEE